VSRVFYDHPDHPLYRRRLIPIANQLGDGRVLCHTCLPEEEAEAIIAAGGHVGDVHPWTANLEQGDPDLACDRCGVILLPAPSYQDEDGEGAEW